MLYLTYLYVLIELIWSFVCGRVCHLIITKRLLACPTVEQENDT